MMCVHLAACLYLLWRGCVSWKVLNSLLGPVSSVHFQLIFINPFIGNNPGLSIASLQVEETKSVRLKSVQRPNGTRRIQHLVCMEGLCCVNYWLLDVNYMGSDRGDWLSAACLNSPKDSSELFVKLLGFLDAVEKRNMKLQV